MKKIFKFIFPVLMVSMSSCVIDDGVYHCDARSTLSLVVDYTGPNWTIDSARTNCNGGGGTLVEAGVIPTANCVGKCSNISADGQPVISYYYSTGGAPYDVFSAEAECDFYFGTFSATCN